MIVHTSPVEDRLLATVCEVDRDVVFEIVERLDKMITERESVIVDLNEQLRELAKVIVEKDAEIDSLKEEICSLERDEARKQLKAEQEDNWTASLCDRVNEFIREHRVCDEVKDGPDCSKAITFLHGHAGSLRARKEGAEAERDQLRKVCDELANATRAEFGELNWRLDEYNALPHVKQ